MALEFKLLQPLEYHRQFWAKNLRPDGRKLSEFRPMLDNIDSISSSDGSALIKLGNTTVICGIKAEVTEPKIEIPDQGFIEVIAEMHPMSSSKFKPGSHEDTSAVVTQFIHEVLNRSSFVDLRELCLKEGKFVWNLQIELICLNYDGTIFDACVAALLSALSCCRLPKVTIQDDKPVIDKNTRTKINLYSFPVAASFTFIDGKILADPTADEEALSNTVSTIVTDPDDESIILIYKPGGNSCNDSELLSVCHLATNRAKVIKSLILQCLTPKG